MEAKLQRNKQQFLQKYSGLINKKEKPLRYHPKGLYILKTTNLYLIMLFQSTNQHV
jgi:hypothetical protein